MPLRGWSDACERNKAPILAHLEFLFRNASRVLEIGSGSGQHAMHFAAGMPWLQWICSDLEDRHATIRAILAGATANIEGPLTLDAASPLPPVAFDSMFTANTLHIMPWPAVASLFHNAAESLPDGGRFVVYGPFHYGNAPISAGNAVFDIELRGRGAGEGIRDIEAVQSLAVAQGFRFLADCALPANNRLLAWEKT